MKGWLSKYDDTIVAQGGETISLSREDYLRQQYQNYLKSQAEKGRKAVVEGREKFAKDYLIPATKTVGSFTPAGPIIGLMDAKQAWDEGNRGWAIAGAAAEALPYAGKIVGKGLSTISKIGKYEILPTPKLNAYYRNIGGKEGYTDVLKRREIAPPIISIPETTGFRAIDGKISLPKKQFNRAFYAHKGKFSPALRYKGPYAVEAEVPMTNGFGGNWGFAPNPKTEGFINIPLDDSRVRILKQYRLPKTEKVLFQKELPKKEQVGIIPKAQGGGEIDAVTSESAPYWQIPIKQREDFKGNWLSYWGSGNKRREVHGRFGDLYRYFGGDELKHNILYKSRYKPSNSKDPDAEYIAIKDTEFENDIINSANRIFNNSGEKVVVSDKKINDNTYQISGYGTKHGGAAIGRYFVSEGKDDNGNYISYYDIFDKGTGKKGINETSFGATKPFEIYDRIYVDKDSTGRYVPREEFKNGGQLKKSKQLRTFTNGWLDKYL